MTEYINREELRKHLKECYDNELFDADMRKVTFGIDVYVENMPTADVQPATKWISVKEQLPQIGRNVLIYYPKWDGDEIQVAKLDCDGITFDICGEFNIGTGVITHWMPLPEPPQD